jgi:hypothetical protein
MPQRAAYGVAKCAVIVDERYTAQAHRPSIEHDSKKFARVLWT